MSNVKGAEAGDRCRGAARILNGNFNFLCVRIPEVGVAVWTFSRRITLDYALCFPLRAFPSHMPKINPRAAGDASISCDVFHGRVGMERRASSPRYSSPRKVFPITRCENVGVENSVRPADREFSGSGFDRCACI